jgi:hypothetical protein
MAKNKNGKPKADEKPSISIPAFLADAIGARLDDPLGREKFPRICEAMHPQYDGGKMTVAPGKITVSIQGHHYVVKLDLPTFVLQATVIVGSLGDALEALEAYLAGRPVFTPGYSKTRNKVPTLDDAIQ